MPKGKDDLNDREFLIRNHGGQKEMAKYFSSSERKNPLTPSSLSSEKYPSGIQDKSNSQKHKRPREFVVSRQPKRTAGRSSPHREEMIKRGAVGPQEEHGKGKYV